MNNKIFIQVIFSLLLCTLTFNDLSAQLFEIERLSDTSLKIIATGNTVLNTNIVTEFNFNFTDLLETIPSDSPNLNSTLSVNGIPNTSRGASSVTVTFWFFAPNVAGDITASGSVIVSWPDGLLKQSGVATVEYSGGGSEVAQMTVPTTNVPTLSEWGLILLALLLMTLGTLVLVQPSTRLKQER